MIFMGTDSEGRTTVFNGGGYIETIGTRSHYPAPYVPVPVTQRRLIREYVRDCVADVRDHKWFWTVTAFAVGFLVYHILAFAMTQEWSRRIG